jgi:hypothetical protein
LVIIGAQHGRRPIPSKQPDGVKWQRDDDMREDAAGLRQQRVKLRRSQRA